MRCFVICSLQYFSFSYLKSQCRQIGVRMTAIQLLKSTQSKAVDFRIGLKCVEFSGDILFFPVEALTFPSWSANVKVPPKTEISTWNKRFQETPAEMWAFPFVGLHFLVRLIFFSLLISNDFR